MNISFIKRVKPDNSFLLKNNNKNRPTSNISFSGCEGYGRYLVNFKGINTPEAVLNDIKQGRYEQFGIKPEEAQEFDGILNDFNVQYFIKIAKANTFEDGKFRFKPENISQALEYLNEERIPGFLTLLNLKDKKTGKYRIKGQMLPVTLAYINKANPQFLDYLFNRTFDQDRPQWFNDNATLTVLEKINENNTGIFKLLASSKAANDQESYRFNSHDHMNQILSNLQDKDINEFKSLLEARQPAGNKYLYSEQELATQAVIIKYNLDSLSEEIKNKQSSQGRKDLFESGDIHTILSYIDNKAQTALLSRLINDKDPETNDYRFNKSDIITILLKVNESNDRILLEALSQKVCQGDRQVYRFKSAKNLAKLIDSFRGLKNRHLDTFKKVSRAVKPGTQKPLLTEDQLISYCRLIPYDLPHDKIINGDDIESLTDSEIVNFLRFYRQNRFYEEDDPGVKSPLIVKADDQDDFEAELIRSLSIFKVAQNALKPEPVDKSIVFDHLTNLTESIKTLDLDKFESTGLPVKFDNAKFNSVMCKNTGKFTNKDQILLSSHFSFVNSPEKVKNLAMNYLTSLEEVSTLLTKAEEPDKIRKFISFMNQIFLDSFEFNLPENKNASKALKDIIKVFPEFLTTTGKSDARGDKIDIHLLKVLKTMTGQPEFKNIPEYDQNIAKVVALFHDITKEENIVDRHHPDSSEYTAYAMLQRTSLNIREIERICGLIKNHHWVENLENNDKSVKDVAFDFRRPHDLDISVALTGADLIAAKNEHFLSNFNTKYKPIISDIRKLTNDIQTKAIYLPQTRIPKASEIKARLQTGQKADFVTVDGPNVFIKINPDTPDLESLGFDEGTCGKNFSAIVHTFSDYNTNITKDINYAAKEGNNGVFSTSYLTSDKHKTFADMTNGLIFDVDPNNIALAIKNGVGSGLEKNIDTFKKFLFCDFKGTEHEYYEEENVLEARNTFSKSIAGNNPELTGLKYVDFYNNIVNNRSLTDITDNNTKQLLLDSIDKTMFEGDDYSNEVVVYSPKPIGVILHNADMDELFPHVREYATANDLPIIIMDDRK